MEDKYTFDEQDRLVRKANKGEIMTDKTFEEIFQYKEIEEIEVYNPFTKEVSLYKGHDVPVFEEHSKIYKFGVQ